MSVAKPIKTTTTLSQGGKVAKTTPQKKKLIDDAISTISKRVRSKSSGKLAGADRIARPR